jgi:hypothetical protein
LSRLTKIDSLGQGEKIEEGSHSFGSAQDKLLCRVLTQSHLTRTLFGSMPARVAELSQEAGFAGYFASSLVPVPV